MKVKTGTILMALIVVSGILMFEFAPGGFLYQKGGPGLSAHSITHLIAGGLAVIAGAAVLVMRKKLGSTGAAIGGAGLVLGLVFALEAGAIGPLYKPLAQIIPHGTGMQVLGGLTIVVGLVGLLLLEKAGKVKA